MEYLIGVGLALLVCAFARLVGFDRDRAFYSTMVLVVATYYILFAVMGVRCRRCGWNPRQQLPFSCSPCLASEKTFG
jgi:hypothetical protein